MKNTFPVSALERLTEAGFSSWFVGGCVRDALRGVVPHDFDIATAATPPQVAAVFSDVRVVETGRKHGTLTVLWDGSPLEITTLRRETGYADHRHPDAVCFTTRLEEDLARRDFTVNALAWSPDGGLVDLYGGRADLERRVLRCVGDPERRFSEDALRILRALRFSAVLEFSVEEATARAALDLRETLRAVSAERVAAELRRLVCGPAAAEVVTEFWPVLAVPIPELAPMAGLDQHSVYHCWDVLTHSARTMANVPPDPVLRLAALLHDVGKPACFTLDAAGRGHFYGHAAVGAPMAEAILTRLRFEKDAVRRVTQLVRLHDYPLDPPPEGSPEKAVKRLLGRLGERDFFDLLAVKRADALAHHPDCRGRAARCDELAALARRILDEKQPLTVRDLAVNGRDLLALGLTGPAVGRALAAMLDAVVAGKVPNERDALLSCLKKLS